MGTHPIFESDFDCLTDLISALNHASQVAKEARTTSQAQAPKDARTLQVSCESALRLNLTFCDVRLNRTPATLFNSCLSNCSILFWRVFIFNQKKFFTKKKKKKKKKKK